MVPQMVREPSANRSQNSESLTPNINGNITNHEGLVYSNKVGFKNGLFFPMANTGSQ